MLDTGNKANLFIRETLTDKPEIKLDHFDEKRDFQPKGNFIWNAPDIELKYKPELIFDFEKTDEQQKCLPFRNNFRRDAGRDGVVSEMREEYLKTLVTFCYLFPKTEQKHKEALVFTIYKKFVIEILLNVFLT